jgi:hypothetical protein
MSNGMGQGGSKQRGAYERFRGNGKKLCNIRKRVEKQEQEESLRV